MRCEDGELFYYLFFFNKINNFELLLLIDLDWYIDWLTQTNHIHLKLNNRSILPWLRYAFILKPPVSVSADICFQTHVKGEQKHFSHSHQKSFQVGMIILISFWYWNYFVIAILENISLSKESISCRIAMQLSTFCHGVVAGNTEASFRQHFFKKLNRQ